MFPSQLLSLPRLAGPMLIVTASMFLNFAGFTIIIPVMPFLIGQYVDPDLVGPLVGIITSVYAFGQLISAPALGALSDHVGRRPVLLLSLTGSVIGYIVLGIGGALWVLFLGRIIDGLTGGNISTIYAYVADISEPRDRGRYYGVLGAAGGLGFIVGPAIGGFVGEFSVTAPMFVAAAVTTANIVWAYFALPESVPADRRGGSFTWSQLNPLSPLTLLSKSAALRIAFAAAFLFYFAATMLQSNVSVFLKDILAFGPAQIGIVLFVVGVMDIVSQGFLTGHLLPRFGERALARGGLFINAFGYILIALVALVPSVVLIFAGVIVLTLGDGLFQPSMGGIIANAAPRGAQGAVQGANQAQQSIARIVGPLLAAYLYTVAPSAPYVVAACVVLLGLTILSVFVHTPVRAST
jgi:DHA1 family tetracycline resistance protein-like MFS transporter